MAKNTDKILGEISAQQINTWKNKYPSGVYAISTQDDEGTTHLTYVRKPDINALSAAGKYAESDPFKSGDLLFNTLRLGGSEQVVSDEEMRIGVIKALKKLFKIKEAEVKKL